MPEQIGPNKAIAAGSAGTVSLIIIAILGAFGVTVSPELAAALTTLAATALAYFVPHGA